MIVDVLTMQNGRVRKSGNVTSHIDFIKPSSFSSQIRGKGSIGSCLLILIIVVDIALRNRQGILTEPAQTILHGKALRHAATQAVAICEYCVVRKFSSWASIIFYIVIVVLRCSLYGLVLIIALICQI